MKSIFSNDFKTGSSRLGIISFLCLLFCTTAVFGQPITVLIQTPDGAREVCQGPSSFILTASAQGGNQEFVTYTWSASPGMITPVGDYAIFNNSFSAIPGNYVISVTVLDSYGNSGTGSITITLKATPTASITANGPTTFCLGESVTLTASPANSFQYLWRRGITDISGADQPNYTATEDGNYRVRITAENGCFSLSNIIAVTVNPLPDVSASNNGPVCEGQSVQLTGGPSGLASYSWTSPTNPGFSSNLQNPVISNITSVQAGTYTLTVTDANGCRNTASTLVVVNPVPTPPVSASASQTNICSGLSGQLTLTANGGSGQLLRWFQGSCGGTEIGQGNNISVAFPTVTTTYFVRWETAECGQSVCASVTVNVTQAPILNTSSTPISCAGLANGTATVNISGGTPPYSILWNTGATTASISNLAQGTYTVTVTDVAGCIVSRDVTVSEPEPIVLTFTNVEVPKCNGGADGRATVVVNGGTPPFSYLWSNGQTTQTATALAAGTYQVTVTDQAGCIESASITINPPPVLAINTVSLTHVLCHGQSTGAVRVVAINGTEPYTYLWNTGQSGPELINIPAGTYSVTATDANGCQAILSIVINQTPPLIVSAGADQTICTGQSATLTGTGANTYVWSTGETTASIEVAPLVTTTYSVTGTTECGQATAQVTVFVNESHVVNLGNDVEVCQGPQLTIDAGAFANVSYLWSTGDISRTITVTTTGIYWVRVTNTGNGCIGSDTIAVIINPLPPAETGPNQTLCFGQEIRLGPTNPPPSPTSTYMWTSVPPDPSLVQPTISNPTVRPLVTTVYTLVETYLNTGCQNTRSVTITLVGAAPDPGPNQTICQGQSVTIGPATPNPGSTYYWTSSNPNEVFDWQIPNPVVTPQITTTYTIHEVAGQCTFTATVTITVNPAPQANAGTDKQICRGETIMIGPEVFVPNPASTYLWTSVPPDASISNPAISNPLVRPLVTTVYTLIETFTATGCSRQNSITVTVNEIPVALVASDATICQGTSINIGSPNAPQALTYQWTSVPAGFLSNLSNPQVSPTVTTTYYLEVTTAAGCKGFAEVTITVNPAPVPNVSPDILFCSQAEVQPVNIGGAPVAGLVYSWTSNPPGFSSNEANPLVTLTGTSPVTYILTATNQFGCAAVFTVRVSISDLRVVTVNPSLCENEASLNLGSLATVSGGKPPYTYRWTDPAGNQLSTTSNFVASPPFFNSYRLQVTDADGCSRTQTINLVLWPAPIVQLLVNPTGTAFIGQIVTITALPAGFLNYEFFVDGVSVQSGNSNFYSSYMLRNGQVVAVRATTVDGCSSTAQPVTMVISGLPNAFTPDGDGINDTFGRGYQLVIFNRWGQTVYQGTEGWDGKHNGRNVSPGTYYYILEVDYENDEKTVLKGSVTVIRHRSQGSG